MSEPTTRFASKYSAAINDLDELAVRSWAHKGHDEEL